MLLTPEGELHAVWEESSAGLNELLYQRRVGFGLPIPTGEVLVSSGLAIQHPRLVDGADGVIHLVYETANPPTEGVRYRRWRPGRGWDAMSTDILSPSILGGARPVALPQPGGDVTVVFIGEQDQRSRLVVRRRVPLPRVSDAPGPAPAPAPSIAASGLALGPNPLRAGQTLRAWTITAAGAPGSGSPMLDVFDASGRRVAAVATLRVGSRLEARVPGGSTSSWPAGMYFARLRGSRSERARITVVR